MKIRPVIARFVRSGSSPGAASLSAAGAGITCPARITINAKRLQSIRAKRLLCGKHQKKICFAVPARVAAGSVFDEEEPNVALKITTREVDGVTVAALDGRIVLGEESNALREKIKSLVAEGKKKVVLNMDNITFIDSAGLGTLVASHHSAKAQGAALKLCHLGTKFQEVLQITKLMTIFDVYNTEAEAVASFSK
jgi:anti-sigma B factor antagonist